jgi:hypothetical protein
VKKDRKKLTLNRDTVRALSAPALGEVAAAAVGTHQSCSCYITCWASCRGSCDTCVGTVCIVC